MASFLPELFPPSFRGPDGNVAVYFEAAAVIVTLVLLGQMLEQRTRHRTSGAIRALLNLAPKTARIVMLTGDNETTARAVAGELNIDEVEAEVSPDRKNEIVKQLHDEGRTVAMAGDGINDAPHLHRLKWALPWAQGQRWPWKVQASPWSKAI